MYPPKYKLLQAFAAAAMLTTFTFTFTAAHEIEPVSASPAPGEILQQSPVQVRLVFEEEITEDGSSLQVFDTSGKQVDQGKGGVDLNDPQHATLIVKLPALAEGVYQVKWKITLSDGDASQGEYRFGVGNVTIPSSPASEAPAGQQPASSGPSPVVWGTATIGAILVVLIGVYFSMRSRSAL